MAGAQPQEVINPDASPVEEIGASIVGGLRPFFIGTAIATVLATAVASAASYDMNMWTSLVLPVVAGVIVALASDRRS